MLFFEVEPGGATLRLFLVAHALQIQLSRLKETLLSKNKNPKQASLMGFYLFIHNTVVSDCGAGGTRTQPGNAYVQGF
ncbi:hypothetical protein SAMN05660866_00113 [Maribacter arcticus]|uniref:Uncharacterized protein n=1 Tax=Maribacter arcticus TaxID=561365 RepID=A0A1T4ZQG2_9FLAO|nr:hypothetical protein SAMN05660866_00113 [Maribacter arcticus]